MPAFAWLHPPFELAAWLSSRLLQLLQKILGENIPVKEFQKGPKSQWTRSAPLEKCCQKKNDSYRNIRTCRQIGQGSLGEFVCLFCSVAGFLFGQVCKSWKKQDGARANAKVSYIKYISNYIILYACVYLSTYMSICMYIHVCIYIYKFPKKTWYNMSFDLLTNRKHSSASPTPGLCLDHSLENVIKHISSFGAFKHQKGVWLFSPHGGATITHQSRNAKQLHDMSV